MSVPSLATARDVSRLVTIPTGRLAIKDQALAGGWFRLAGQLEERWIRRRRFFRAPSVRLHRPLDRMFGRLAGAVPAAHQARPGGPPIAVVAEPDGAGFLIPISNEVDFVAARQHARVGASCDGGRIRSGRRVVHAERTSCQDVDPPLPQSDERQTVTVATTRSPVEIEVRREPFQGRSVTGSMFVFSQFQMLRSPASNPVLHSHPKSLFAREQSNTEHGTSTARPGL